MSRETQRRLVTALFIAAAVMWQVLAAGLLFMPLVGEEALYGYAAASRRRCAEEGLVVTSLTPDVGFEMRDRYGITNRGVILNQVHVETLAQFIEAARPAGVVYVSGVSLLAMGDEDLLEYSPVVVTRMWPYGATWVNQ